MKTRFQSVIGLLINVKMREAGSMEKDGKKIEWGEADQLILLPLENPTGKIMKLNMSPTCAKSIYEATKDVCWGALVEVGTDGRHAVSVTILADWLANVETR